MRRHLDWRLGVVLALAVGVFAAVVLVLHHWQQHRHAQQESTAVTPLIR